MADLSCFATKVKADEGVILPVKIGGTKIPLAIKLYGSDSDVVQEFERERLREVSVGIQGKNQIDEEKIDALLDKADDAVIVRIGGVYAYDWKAKKVIEGESVELLGTVIKDDEKSYRFLIENMPAIKDWVKENSNNRDNFLSVGKKN